MKKFLILFLGLALITVSCKEKRNYQEEIQGKWLCQETNNLILPTNDAFVFQFNENMTLMKANGVIISEDSARWEETDFNYSIDNETIIVTGNAKNNVSYQIKILTDNKLMLTKGKESYTFYKITENLQNSLIGRWQGIVQLPDDTFNIEISCQVDKSFILKKNEIEEINGKYNLYGNLIAVNYNYPLPTKNYGLAYQNWLIFFDKADKNKVEFIRYIPTGDGYNLKISKFILTRTE